MCTTLGAMQNSESPGSLSEDSVSDSSRPASENTAVPGTIGTSVVDIVNQRDTPVCGASATLTHAAALLMSCGRTAAVVADEDGTLLGAITENDFLIAYESGVPWDYPVRVWLQSGNARLPGYMLQDLTVQPSAPLVKAAAQMRAHAGGEFASRHLIVKDKKIVYGILSSLDLACALCSTAISELVHSKTVGQVMKTRSALPTVASGTTLDRAFRELSSSKQNCVLIADDKFQSPGVLDVVTTRDVLRAFAGHIQRDIVARKWLRGSQRSLWPRMVRADANLVEAAATMKAHGVHHLVVVSPTSSEVIIGLLSSADLAHVIASASPSSFTV